MGLTRTTASAADGVVDADSCIHSWPNFSIASAAVFPTTGAAPATLTLAALSLRFR
jgi:choline dehydrogenase-like flavoprotein